MIGGMVETELAMSCSACLAAGLVGSPTSIWTRPCSCRRARSLAGTLNAGLSWIFYTFGWGTA